MFAQHASALSLYTQYINGYDTAIATLQKVSRDNKKFIQFVSEKCENQSSAVLLPSLLIQPIQRIPRYVYVYFFEIN